MDIATLQAFETEITKHVPKFKIAFKDEATLMKFLGFFAVAFNPRFMTAFTTTLGSTVYFPSKASYEAQPKSSFTILAHEFVHMKDSERYPGWYHLSYIFPQGLSPLVLAAYAAFVMKGWIPVVILALGVVLGCLAARKSAALLVIIAVVACVVSALAAILLTGWWSTLFFGGVALLAPLPSPWRVKWELRGYTMSLAVLAWTYGSAAGLIRDMTARHFYGPDYYFMSWTKATITAQLDHAILQAQDGTLQKDPVFAVVHSFLATRDAF